MFDKKLDELDATVDLDKRKVLAQTLEQTLSNEVPAIITYHRGSPKGIKEAWEIDCYQRGSG